MGLNIGNPVNRNLASAIVDGKVELLGVDEIVDRLGVSRSTLERWVRNGKAAAAMSLIDRMASKGQFPEPDIYIGSSPKWTKDTVVNWLVANSSSK